ncbi:MAG: 5-(carboxyamino)imidazole ribonucleotide synthase [Flammeovirgaceae bacterium]|nr:5-(carboxyamino)imidazole ribonucleotide synthase [Flammeovirgaceae bacterium]MBE63808.1 5-(carboxyamino)imidazole ribonucleotide synthase [Flammeovirgaceae bacterium]MBR09543.1 5-(carboxyamino)imidazole ribonucleotide synthase [Rickettsiales bacterium]HCX24937.1 5-(carboxyamino)imidazole ribonucleotide synthase [Cytophagales bacterium]|tara:strand:- start:12701 stop:13840 length:1140 start_codon:yes stop_codon:yes gene_type:complete
MSKDITDLKIGVLGGGQLGRMMLQSSTDFNLDIHMIDPDPNAPCSKMANSFTQGALTDYDTIMAFGADKDVLTIEIEAVSTEALKELEKQGKKVFPQPAIVEMIQDKRKQKTFYKANRIPTADFILTENADEVKSHEAFLPAVNKLGKGGYDGQGVQIIKSAADLDKAFDAPSLLEKLVYFKKELSVIVARNEAGEVKCFPLVEMAFHPTANLVEFLFAPAEVTKEVEEKAYALAEDVITKLDMVGLLAVEMFLTQDDQILVNEIAPRTHNSGHQTIEANITSQFEQHLRAILNLPLGSTELIKPAAMVNVLGEDGFTGNAKYEGLNELLSIPGVHLHLYGKKLTKPFRKMGHITITDESTETLKAKALKVKEILKVKA